MSEIFLNGEHIPTTYCQHCDNAIMLNARGELEFELYVLTHGGYMSFRDDMKPLADLKDVVLCHDCAVKLYRFLNYDPSTQKEHRGLHPDMNDGERGEPMCCEFAWRSHGPGGVVTDEYRDEHIEYGFELIPVMEF